MDVKKGNLKIYLASPYGFTDTGREFMMNTMIPAIQETDFEILNPWDSLDSTGQQIEKISSLNDIRKQKEMLRILNEEIASQNARLLEKAEIVIAILDGTDVDSGVASEIGYAFALKKKIIGYRSDFRLTGDNLGAVVNLQVEYFINRSGGTITRNISELKQTLREVRSSLVKAH